MKQSLEDKKKQFYNRFVDSDPSIQRWDEGMVVLLSEETQELWEWIEALVEEVQREAKEEVKEIAQEFYNKGFGVCHYNDALERGEYGGKPLYYDGVLQQLLTKHKLTT